MNLAIRSSKVFSGPSVYAQFPVILFSLSESITSPERQTVAILLDALEGILPGLRNHMESCGMTAGYRKNREEGAPAVCHLFEHICMVLQDVVGVEPVCVRAEASHWLGVSDAAVSYVPEEDPDICLHSAQLAVELLAAAESGQLTRLPEDAERLGFDVEILLSKFHAFVQKHRLKKQDHALISAARAGGIPVRKLAGRLLVLGHSRYQQRINGAKTSLTNVVSDDIAANKDYTRRILAYIGLCVPRYKRVNTEREAVKAAKHIGYPVVVKPNNAGSGNGVSIGIYDRSEVREAYKHAREFDRSVLIEELIEGNDYRLLVVNGKFCTALKRIPAHVVGDSVHSIEQLVTQVNSQFRLGTDQASMLTTLPLDELADRLLLVQGYDRQSVPAKDVIVYLRRNANLSAGGIAHDVTENVHPENRKIAERAARAIGLDIVGVDILTTDISTSMWENGGRINGINSRPGDIFHLWADVGKTGQALKAIMEMLFPPNQPAQVPIVAVTGTGDTETTARILASMLTKAGRQVGLVVGRRVYSAGQETALRDISPPDAARAILLDPDVDVAVLELKPGDILSFGLDNNPINHTVIVNSYGSGHVDDTGESFNTDVLNAIRVAACATIDTIYAFDGDDFATSIIHGIALPRVCRIVTKTNYSKTTTSHPKSTSWSILARMGLKTKSIKEDQQMVAREDTLLFGGISPEQFELLRTRLTASAGDMDTDSALRAVLAASAAAIGLGIESSHIYRVLSEYRFKN